MKKKKLTGLSLNKKTISNLQAEKVKGGGYTLNPYPNSCLDTYTTVGPQPSRYAPCNKTEWKCK